MSVARVGRGEWRTGQAAVSMAPGGRRVRPAAVAGRFYPGDARALRERVRHLLDAVTVPDDEPPAAAYVVPHAGYRYSGPTAAHVYARLRAAAGGVDRVVLAGPAHHLPVRGCVVPTVERWATPLGEQVVDVAGARALVAAGWAVAGDAPHAPEHSLEVQVPFLQEVLRPGVPLLPVVVGPDRPGRVATALAAALDAGGRGGGTTVLLCSTDLSHHLGQADARKRDRRTAQAVLDLSPERIGDGDACGAAALRGTVELAHQRGLRPRLLHLCTSGDTPHGSPEQVVGYAAVAFTRPERGR